MSQATQVWNDLNLTEYTNAELDHDIPQRDDSQSHVVLPMPGQSASIGLNVWFLNYQAIAALLDLGLQRSGKGISILEQEPRTRTFWVIYSLDRSIATIMGRPIGLTDEACELRVCSPIVAVCNSLWY